MGKASQLNMTNMKQMSDNQDTLDELCLSYLKENMPEILEPSYVPGMPSSDMDTRRRLLEEKYVKELRECLLEENPELVISYDVTYAMSSLISKVNLKKVKKDIERTLNERGDTYLQAIIIKEQLSQMSFDLNGYNYKWDDSFLTNTNCIKLIDACKEFNINSPEERAYFLGQIFVETAKGETYREIIGGKYGLLDQQFDANLAESYFANTYPNGISKGSYYYTCNNLTKEFISQIPVGDVDENLFQNTDIVVYRGGGALQTTFKENYYRFALSIEETNPEAAQDIRENGAYSHWMTDEYRFISAAWDYTVNKGINSDFYKDHEGQSVDEIVIAITKKVNGGSNGLDKRKAATDALLEVLK